jgi:putative oxidoreductase
MSCQPNCTGNCPILKDDEIPVVTINNNIDQTGGFFWFIPTSFIARVMIASFFIVTGVLSAMNFSTFTASLSKLGIPNVTLIAGIALVMKIFGGILFTGILAIPNGVGIGQLALLVVMIATIATTSNAFADRSLLPEMLANIAIMGGLLLA